MPHLQFKRDNKTLFTYTLRAGRTLLGRSDRCDVALPDEGVSRLHCMLEKRSEGWIVTDRSRHGIRINNTASKRAVLEDGDILHIGPYQAILRTQEVDLSHAKTATIALQAAMYEDLLEITDNKLATCQANLRITRGSKEGEVVPLHRTRVSIGGPGSTIVLDPELPRAAVWLRVIRGRVMVEPGEVRALLAGVRLQDITPVLSGEELRLGEHGFVIEVHTTAEATRPKDIFGELVGSSTPMRNLFGMLSRMAQHDAPVLIIGESGTGKELAARGLHDSGPRHEGPFVAVNCAAIADNLFESELFGHEKGSFTGATDRQDGAFHRANEGTLFLDEVGELKLDLQAKLLRVLESGEVKRVGSCKPEFPDVRVVAATNRDLAKMVKEGSFREDLFFRLSVLPIRTPPLRERPEDIVVLAQTLLARNHPDASLAPDGAHALKSYHWPGNVRELRNVLTRSVVLNGPVIHAGGLEFNPWAFDGENKDPGPLQTADHERAMIESALSETANNKTKAALQLGMPRSTLLYKMRRHGLM